MKCIRFSYHDADIVILELNKVRKSNIVPNDTILPPVPSPPGFVYYDRKLPSEFSLMQNLLIL
jgi:hypothetical protein